jgi:hypothetical protein
LGTRVRAVLLLSLVVALAVPAACAWAVQGTSVAADPVKAKAQAKDAAGRKLYRKWCGQCHVFKPARAVGFGQDKPNADPGPSFDYLRVPWGLSVNAIVLAIGGHETLYLEMSWQELYDVSKWLDTKTKHNKILATLTGANFTRASPTPPKPK